MPEFSTGLFDVSGLSYGGCYELSPLGGQCGRLAAGFGISATDILVAQLPGLIIGFACCISIALYYAVQENFISHGGNLILFTSWNDISISPWQIVPQYRGYVRKYGQDRAAEEIVKYNVYQETTHSQREWRIRQDLLYTTLCVKYKS